VQLDGAYLGGERSGGKVCRGSENKVPFVAAVAGQPMRMKLDLVSRFISEAIAKWAKARLLPNTTVLSDGLACIAAVTEAGCVHTPKVDGTHKPRHLPEFKWVNTVLGNLKTMLASAYKALKFRKYAQTYLAAFAYRFNHRFDLRDRIATLIVDVAITSPIPENGSESGML
jgi:hypothetical protein